MILVIGGTGVLGQRVVRRLRQDGLAVRVMTRAPARAAALQALGAQPVAGDLTDTASLRAACAGAEYVLAAAHGFLGRGHYASPDVDDAGHRALIDAAAQAGVKRFVYVSAFGASPTHPVDFWRTKYAIERYLNSSGMAHVILRPSGFLEWHAHEFIGKSIVDGRKARMIGPGTKSRNFIAADDVAAIAVRALLGDFGEDSTLELGGPANYSNLEVARLYAQACGAPLRVSHLPARVAATLSRLIKPFHPGVARVLYLGSLPDDAFDERFDVAGLVASHPMALTRLEDFILAQVEHARSGTLRGA